MSVNSPPSSSGTTDPLTTVRDRLKEVSFRQLGLGAFLVALAFSVPFGGFESSRAETVVPLRVGEVIDVHPIRLEVVRVRYLAPTETDKTPKVGVVAKVTSLDETRSVPAQVLKDLLRIDGIAQIKAPFSDEVAKDPAATPASSIIVLTDEQAMGDLPPHLTHELGWIWDLMPGSASPTSLTLTARTHTYRESNITQDQFEWFDTTPFARGSFDVQQGKPA